MDTGVVFCRRADFVTVGGYDERRYFAEDVVFLWALKRLGRSRSSAPDPSATRESDRVHTQVRSLRRLALLHVDAQGRGDVSLAVRGE